MKMPSKQNKSSEKRIVNGLVYSPGREMVGVVVGNMVFYPNGRQEKRGVGLCKFSSTEDFLTRIAHDSQSHQAGLGALVSIREYSDVTGIDKKQLATFGASALGFLCGVRWIRIGPFRELYFPLNIKAELVNNIISKLERWNQIPRTRKVRISKKNNMTTSVR